MTGVAAWLAELGLERYANAFVEEGYENLSYIAEMTLEDVLEIKGMKKPHAKRIYKSVHVGDSLHPNPGNRVSPVTKVTAWLAELELERYTNAFVEDGYDSLSYIAEMSLEDVLDIKGMKKAYARRIHKASSNLKTP